MKKRRRKKAVVAMCQAPDRDVPALTCGYPLPCPHHNFRKVVRVAVILRSETRR
jgi:hypothetical protein